MPSLSHSPQAHPLLRAIQPWVDLTRATKLPAGTMVVYWPFAWGATMAARTAQLPLPQVLTILLVGFIGASVSHSAGCVWNDILDRDFDAQVERTKDRPVASGKVTVTGASIFLIAHIAVLLLMIWDAYPLAWMIGLITIFPLAGFYPLMKRITFWPQAWLGIAINTGIVMGWAWITNSCPSSAWVLSAGAWSWTLWYDTIYACQDKKDDVKAGVKSTALLFGSRVKFLLMFFGGAMICALFLSGWLNNQISPYFVMSVLGGASHLAWQLYTVDPDSPKSCWKTFHANGFYFGAIVELGLFLDYCFA